jgi:hypothetical protein
MKIEVSDGEILDKVSILMIKSERIKDEEKLKNVRKELQELGDAYVSHINPTLLELFEELKKVNECLWDIEDKIRQKEKEHSFDEEFIQLARSVYIENDKRATIKMNINIFTKSSIVEEKSYTKY